MAFILFELHFLLISKAIADSKKQKSQSMNSGRLSFPSKN